MTFAPRQTLLFTGHMIDVPDRPRPRLPARMEEAAARRIGAALDTLHAGPQDLAFTQGAAGGDLLFAEACLARGVPLQLLLPLNEHDFIAESIRASAGGDAWQRRFEAVKGRLDRPILEAPAVLGPLDRGESELANAFARGNRWLLDRALAAGGVLQVICLWDGGAGDGPGGTQHLVDAARSQGAAVVWIDTRTLEGPDPLPAA